MNSSLGSHTCHIDLHAFGTIIYPYIALAARSFVCLLKKLLRIFFLSQIVKVPCFSLDLHNCIDSLGFGERKYLKISCIPRGLYCFASSGSGRT